MSDMRARLLAAALRVIRERGVARATTREIAHAAGVSEGSIFNHFPSKAALLKAVFTEGIDDPMPAAMQRLWTNAGAGDVRENLVALVVAAARFYREVLPLSGPQFVNQPEIEQMREEVPDEQFGPIVGHNNLTRYLAVEQRLGRLDRRLDPALLAVAVLGSCQQYAFLTLTASPAQLGSEQSGLTSDVEIFARRMLNTLLPPTDNEGGRNGR